MSDNNLDSSVDEGEWKPISEDTLFNMFGDMILYSQEEFGIQLSANDFNYEIFDAQYYEEKFPHFSPDVHNLLAEISRQKIIDLRERNEFFKQLDEPRNPFAETDNIVNED